MFSEGCVWKREQDGLSERLQPQARWIPDGILVRHDSDESAVSPGYTHHSTLTAANISIKILCPQSARALKLLTWCVCGLSLSSTRIFPPQCAVTLSQSGCVLVPAACGWIVLQARTIHLSSEEAFWPTGLGMVAWRSRTSFLFNQPRSRAAFMLRWCRRLRCPWCWSLSWLELTDCWTKWSETSVAINCFC